MEILKNCGIDQLPWQRIISFAVIALLIFGALYQRNWNLSSKEKIQITKGKKASRKMVNTLVVFLFWIISLAICLYIYKSKIN